VNIQDERTKKLTDFLRSLSEENREPAVEIIADIIVDPDSYRKMILAMSLDVVAKDKDANE
jgi:hypothetical protein